MSAYLVEPEVIQTLATWGTQPGRLELNRNYLALVLAKANIRGCEDRYPDRLARTAAYFLGLPNDVAYYEAVQQDLEGELPHANKIQRLLGVYAYQACELREWKDSEARAYVEQLKVYAGAKSD